MFVHAPFIVEMLSLGVFYFLFSSGLWFKMQTGQQVTITVASEMMLVPLRSIRFLGGFCNVQ